MHRTLAYVFLAAGAAGLIVLLRAAPAQTTPPRRNVIIFVADGLRPGSVNERDTPALWRVRAEGTYFRNSYSLFPTLTTANASAIATGRGLGHTGDFGNTIWPGYATFDTANFGLRPATPVPFIEDDQVLSDLDDHFKGNYLGSVTLLATARSHGFNAASIGKLGPTAIQEAGAISPQSGNFPKLSTIIVDDLTGGVSGVALPPFLAARLQQEMIAPEAPSRTNGYGANSRYNNGNGSGTVMANVVQQQWFADVTTRAVLPLFAEDSDKPFVLLFWSRDPDGSQHNNGDSSDTLFPGINGPTSAAGVRNADRTLKQLLDWLDQHPAIKAVTDVVVTSDHGFATISRREIDRQGHTTAAESAKHDYRDPNGAVDTEKGTLPPGFLAIDLALALHTDLYDPDQRSAAVARQPYKKLSLASDPWEHPLKANGLLGTDVLKPDASDATAIVAGNGGSDLIHVPDGRPETVRSIVNALAAFDYTAALFVDDKFGPLPGTLPLSAIGLVGSSSVPRPAIVVAFKVFYFDPDSLQTAVQIADTVLHEGQGNHGGLGRDSTLNNMAAMGPDFKSGFIDDAPVSNADIVPTLSKILNFAFAPASGTGRVVHEALAGAPEVGSVPIRHLISSPVNGLRTLLHFQELDGERYVESACLVPTRADEHTPCR